MKLTFALSIALLSFYSAAFSGSPSKARVMGFEMSEVSFDDVPYENALEFLRVKATQALSRPGNPSDEFMIFEHRFAPVVYLNEETFKSKLRNHVTYHKKNLTLKQLFDDILPQFGLTYEVISITRIAILPIEALEGRLQPEADSDPFR